MAAQNYAQCKAQAKDTAGLKLAQDALKQGKHAGVEKKDPDAGKGV